MPLETATYLPDLVTANPAHTDGLSQADSHMRLLKSTIKATFPNFTSGALSSTQAQLDAAVSTTGGATAMSFKPGTALLPGLYPLGNTNTGFFSPASNQIGLALNGVQVMLMGGTALVTTLSIASSAAIGGAAVASTGAYSGGTGQLVPIGGTLLWWDDTLPAEGGYVWANGVAISRTTYPVLFARWGTKFGAGDGSTTFGIPNLQEATPVGKSTMGGATAPGRLASISGALKTAIGAIFGADTGTIAQSNLPSVSLSTSAQTVTVFAADLAGQRGTNPGTTLGGLVTSGGGGTENATYPVSGASVPLGGSNVALGLVDPKTVCSYIIRAA